ncbi:hypothetical protein IID27_03370 [Patescibacteria group bacterium]|nr:hypothetical protein [Patescibacteria group bacterium]
MEQIQKAPHLRYILPITLKRINTVKTLKCDLCDHEAQGETFEEWMKALMPHYMEAHAEVMNDESKNKEDMEIEKKKWMAENKARFEAA